MIWSPLSEVPQIGCIPSLHPHTGLIDPTADPDHAGYQLWHADSILLLGGVLQLSNPRHGQRDRLGPELPQETCVQDNGVRRLRCIGAEPGPAAQELLGALQGLAVGDLGALGRDARPALILPETSASNILYVTCVACARRRATPRPCPPLRLL